MAERCVKPDQFAEAVAKALQETRDVTETALVKAIDKTARAAVTSTKGKAPRKTGKYRSGWGSKITQERGRGSYGRTVYNRSRPGLTHLLEHGHALRGYVAARTAKTSVKAFPHITKEEEIEQELVKNLAAETEAGE